MELFDAFVSDNKGNQEVKHVHVFLEDEFKFYYFPKTEGLPVLESFKLSGKISFASRVNLRQLKDLKTRYCEIDLLFDDYA